MVLRAIRKTKLGLLALCLVFLASAAPALADGGGYTWTNQTPSGGLHNGTYFRFAVSASGQTMATVNGTDILVSPNAGTIWNNVTTGTALSGKTWGTVAMSANGQTIVATALSDDVYLSTNTGLDWTNITTGKTPHGKSYGDITMSSNGQVISVTASGHIYTSTNGGTAWIDGNVTNSFFQDIASSANGQIIYVVPNGGGANGDVYRSTDTGATFTDVTPSGAEHDHIWTGLSTSASGQVVLTSSSGGDIYISTNGGTTWADLTPSGAMHNRIYRSVTVSANGLVINAPIYGDDVYTSTNQGSTWTSTTPSGVGHGLGWQQIAMSMTGDHMVGTTNTGSGGDILTAANPSLAPTNTATASNAIDSKSVSLSTPADLTTITSSSAVTLASLGKTDGNYTYPLGLVNLSYNTLNAADEVTLTFVTNLSPSQVVARDYNSATGTFTTIDGAVVTATTYGGQPALQVTYTVVDNGDLDSDSVLNQVTDPVGLAVLSTTSSSSSSDPAAPNTGYGQPHSNSTAYAIAAGSIITLAAGLSLARMKKKHN